MDRAPSGVLGAHQVQRAQQRLDDSALRFHVGWVRPAREGRGGCPARARLVSPAHLLTHQRRPTSQKRPNLASMGSDTCPVSIEDSSGFVWVAVSAKTPASRRRHSRDPCIATVYTNAPKQLREVIFADLCTLLRPHGLARDPRESQQCTQMTQNSSERPFLPICVHSCVPQASRVTGRGHGSHDVDGPMASTPDV